VSNALQNFDLANDALNVSLISNSILFEDFYGDELTATDVLAEFDVAKCAFTEVFEEEVVFANHLGAFKALLA
jgi:hypothetical protein